MMHSILVVQPLESRETTTEFESQSAATWEAVRQPPISTNSTPLPIFSLITVQ